MPFSPQSIEHTESRINTMRLQAAAPELLEALRNLMSVTDENHPRWKEARAAIAKATGE